MVKKNEDECTSDGFDTLNMFLKDSNLQLTNSTKQSFIKYLSQSHTEFRKYFPETEQHSWISDSLIADHPTNFTTSVKEHLTDFLQTEHKNKN